jgi:RNA polymerase sigma factor (sigma-70 family)
MPETHTWVEQITKEINKDKKGLQAYRDKLDSIRDPSIDDQNDAEMVEEIIGDMNFALNWMRTGRRPGSRRGVESKGVYKRTAMLDKRLFPSLDLEEKEKVLSDEERRKIADILWKMSERERTCYLLHASYGMSFADIGKELNISKGTVQGYVDRAKKKIFL